jgi:hypothetical protein
MNKTRIIFAALLLGGTLAVCQPGTSPAFPAAWTGEWAGTLEIFNPAAGKVQEIPMELHIFPIDSSGRFTWTIIYGEDKATGVRPYELEVVDAAKGVYAIDEKNSIRMEAWLVGGKFIQWFEVEGSLLFTSTELAGDELVWEIVYGAAEPVSITGGQELEGEKIAPVKTFPVGGIQKARLKRTPEKENKK